MKLMMMKGGGKRCKNLLRIYSIYSFSISMVHYRPFRMNNNSNLAGKRKKLVIDKKEMQLEYLIADRAIK